MNHQSNINDYFNSPPRSSTLSFNNQVVEMDYISPTQPYPSSIPFSHRESSNVHGSSFTNPVENYSRSTSPLINQDNTSPAIHTNDSATTSHTHLHYTRKSNSDTLCPRQRFSTLLTSIYWKDIIINGLLITAWYFFSTSLSVYNKWMFTDSSSKVSSTELASHITTSSLTNKSTGIFPFPLFTTCMHIIIQLLYCSLVLYIFPQFRSQRTLDFAQLSTTNTTQLDAWNDVQSAGHTLSDDNVNSTSSSFGNTKIIFIALIVSCGVATGLDVGLGNMSMKFIPLTFYTMCKSSVLGFVLLFAVLFRLENPTSRLVTIIAVMTIGVLMMAAGEIEFSVLGFSLVMIAAACSGFRWCMTQILLVHFDGTHNPFTSLLLLSPVMFLTLLSLALPFEGPRAIIKGMQDLINQQSVGGFFGTLETLLITFVIPGTLAFCMTSSEFALLRRTSVITLSVAGIFKEVVVLTAASLIFHEVLTLINTIGILITISAIAAYNWFKHNELTHQMKLKNSQQNHTDEFLSDETCQLVRETSLDAHPSSTIPESLNSSSLPSSPAICKASFTSSHVIPN